MTILNSEDINLVCKSIESLIRIKHVEKLESHELLDLLVKIKKIPKTLNIIGRKITPIDDESLDIGHFKNIIEYLAKFDEGSYVELTNNDIELMDENHFVLITYLIED